MIVWLNVKQIIRQAYRKTLLAFAGALVFCVACIQPLDLATEYKGGFVVISGSISNSYDDLQFIDIGITADTKRLPLPVNDAVAYLFDNRGSRIPYSLVDKGRYKLQDNFKGQPGDSYVLEVTLNDGRSYRSTAEKIPTLNGKIKSKGQFKIIELAGVEGAVTQQANIEILADIELPTEAPIYLRWTMDDVWIRNPTDFPDPFNSIPPPCFLSGSVDPQRLQLFNGAADATKELKDFFVGRRQVDKSFLEKHYISVHQHSISFQTYEYWRKTDLLANRNGSIFDTPPAELLGNFTCITNRTEKVFGYFEARNTVTSRFYTLPSDIPIFIEPHCTYYPDKPYYLYDTECLDCMSVPNSSPFPPYWF